MQNQDDRDEVRKHSRRYRRRCRTGKTIDAAANNDESPMNTNEDRPTFWQSLRTTFGRGLVVIVPLVITIWVLNILFSAVDGIISPVFDRLLDRHIPGLGFASMVALILIVGVLSRYLLGKGLFKFFDRIILSFPVTRTFYRAT